MIKLVIGLGNPDKKYQETRHNLGQNIIRAICAKNGIALASSPKQKALLAKHQNTIYAISTDYMNLSGFTVSALANYYKTPPQNIYIIHDDLDLPVGEYRFQFDRSPAGHNGIKSIVEQLDTQAFHRLRVGIDHPRHSANPSLLVEDYVLQPFTSEEKVIIDQTIAKILPELETYLQGH